MTAEVAGNIETMLLHDESDKKMTGGGRDRGREKTPMKEYSELPQVGLLRIKQVLDIIHVSRSGWWEGVRKGRFPAPIKLSPRVTVWKLSDIRELCEGKNPETILFQNPGLTVDSTRADRRI
jgi:prophage regulatory protein